MEYDDVSRIRVGWYNWVVINTPEAVLGIIEKQCINTSSKAPSPLGYDIVTGANRMPTMPYGRTWRVLRSAMHQMTTVSMTATFIPCQESEAKQSLFNLATDVGNQRSFYQHMRLYAFSIVMTNTFGTRVKGLDHPDAQNSIKIQEILRKTSQPGAFIIDEVPPLARLPKWPQPGYREAKRAASGYWI